MRHVTGTERGPTTSKRLNLKPAGSKVFLPGINNRRCFLEVNCVPNQGRGPTANTAAWVAGP